MKILILGNSHVQAVRACNPGGAGLDLQYYAVPGGAGPRLERRGERLWPFNPDAPVMTDVPDAAAQGLDPRPFDVIAFCSLGIGAVRPEYPDHLLRNVGLAELMEPGESQVMPLSRRVLLDHLVSAFIDQLAARRTLARLREIYAGPIVVAPMPLPATGLFQADHPLPQTYGDRCGSFLSLIGQQVLSFLQAMASGDPALTALDYPDPAWLAQGATPDEFVNHPGDPWHMNAAYGALVFDQIRRAAGLG